MNYAIINNIAQFMPVHENDKIKALCDIYNVPYEAVEEIGINDEVMLSISERMLEIYEEYCIRMLYFLRVPEDIYKRKKITERMSQYFETTAKFINWYDPPLY